jgi:hypothetical protein
MDLAGGQRQVDVDQSADAVEIARYAREAEIFRHATDFLPGLPPV